MNWLATVPVILVLLIAVTALAPKGSAHVGLQDGRLRPCPDSPNCVCSEAGEKQVGKIAPLSFVGSPDAAWEKAKTVIASAGGEIHDDENGYLWATFTTRWIRFVDDIELRMDAGRRVIHVRSASRVGYSDLGMNRQRVERLRRMFKG
ncbi:MAG: DUF1499 domain-containing protein [Gammaproteobacteria bacterium]|nr:DUF1499 domain-containing protein [Gammaproteobacteria bacterium]